MKTIYFKKMIKDNLLFSCFKNSNAKLHSIINNINTNLLTNSMEKDFFSQEKEKPSKYTISYTNFFRRKRKS